MKKTCARYVLQLSESAAETHRAEDRGIYRSYLADAAVLLALIVSGAAHAEIVGKMEQHERLWGHTWLQDPAWEPARAAFDELRNKAGMKGA